MKARIAALICVGILSACSSSENAPEKAASAPTAAATPPAAPAQAVAAAKYLGSTFRRIPVANAMTVVAFPLDQVTIRASINERGAVLAMIVAAPPVFFAEDLAGPGIALDVRRPLARIAMPFPIQPVALFNNYASV